MGWKKANCVEKIAKVFQPDGAIGSQKQWQELSKQLPGRLYLNVDGVTFF